MTYSEDAIKVNIVASSLFAFFGTFGNILVIAAFFSVRSLRTITNIFVLQLAFVDLTKASFTLTIKAVNQAQGTSSMSDGFCEITGILRVIGSCQSAVLLAAIATVRYFKVVRPRRYGKFFTMKRTLIYCSVICGGTLLLALLPVIGLGKYTYSQSHGACFVTWAERNIPFRSIYYMFNVGLTFPVLIFCYYNIFRRLREHSRAITPRLGRKGRSATSPPKIMVTKAAADQKRGEKKVDKYPQTGQIGKEPDPSCNIEETSDRAPGKGLRKDSSSFELKQYGKHLALDAPNVNKVERECKGNNESKGKKSTKRSRSDVELEVTKVMFAIVVAYTVCWFPAMVVNILNLSKAVPIPGDVLLLIVTLVDLKVCLNPMIYGIGSRQFRKAFLQVLQRRKNEQDSLSLSRPCSSARVPSADTHSRSSECLNNHNNPQTTSYV